MSAGALARRVPLWCWILALYLAFSFVMFANTWVLHPGDFIGGDGDPQLLIWNLGWTPFQLAHAHSPLVTDYISYPDGVNLMWNANLVLPGAVLWPVTALFGPVASYNVMVTLTPALSGFCAFIALRRYAGALASAIGGVLYGFSPYVIAQMGGHNHVAIAVFPPLALLLLDEIYVRQRVAPLVIGGLLGVATAAQYLTGEEVLATTVIMAAVGTVILAALHRDEVMPRVRHAATALGAAAVVAAVLCAYPLKVQFFGPERVQGALQAPNVYVTDLGNLFVPTSYQLFHTDRALEIQTHFSGNMSESNAYLGLPLIVLLLVAGAVLMRRSALARWCAAMIVAALVISMGTHLHVDGHVTGIPLPWALVGDIGVLQNILPSRFALYAFLMIALAVALSVDAILRSPRRDLKILGMCAVAVALVPLVPSKAYQTDPERPGFFTSADVQRIPAGSVAIIDPFASGSAANARAMLWQAEANYRFRMIDGLAFRPGATGVTQDPVTSELQTVLTGLATGHPVTVTPDVAAQIRAEMNGWQVRTVIVGPSAHEADALALFSNVLRDEPSQTGGVYVFWNAGADVGL